MLEQAVGLEAVRSPAISWFDPTTQSTYDGQVGFGARRPAVAQATPAARIESAFLLLPPRSMVGQPPLERHIGVRIPGGQPIH